MIWGLKSLLAIIFYIPNSIYCVIMYKYLDLNDLADIYVL